MILRIINRKKATKYNWLAWFKSWQWFINSKVTAGLLDHATNDRWPAGSSVLLIHTGGVPTLFAYHEAIEAHLRKRGRLDHWPPAAR